MKPTTKKKTTAPAKVEAPKGEDFEDLGLAADLMSIEEDDGVPPFSVEGFDLDSGASKEKSKAKGKAAKGEAKKEPRATTTKAAKPKTESKAKPKTETKSKAETKPVKEAKPKTETKPKAEAKPKAEPKPKAEAKPKTESKAKPKAEAKPKPLKEPTGTKATATKPRGSRSTSKGELKGLQDIDALKEWEEKNSSLDKAKVQPYDINQSYFKGQAINHATFGVGFVSEVVYPNKIQVKFQHFSKRLIMNVPQPNSKA
jgi:hypothetical protein